MKIEVEIEGKKYEIEYDEKYLKEHLKELGLEPQSAIEYAKRAIVYNAVEPKYIRHVYDKIAEEEKVHYNTVVMQIKRGLRNGEYNGKLKNIDDFVKGSVYDYDYGYTAKEFVSVMSYYMKLYNKMKVKKKEE